MIFFSFGSFGCFWHAWKLSKSGFSSSEKKKDKQDSCKWDFRVKCSKNKLTKSLKWDISKGCCCWPCGQNTRNKCKPYKQPAYWWCSECIRFQSKSSQKRTFMQYFTMPHWFLQEWTHSAGIRRSPEEWDRNPQEWAGIHRNGMGMDRNGTGMD